MSLMTACTRALVAADTPYRSLRTLDTVATETPARAATSRIVTLALGSTAVSYLSITLSTTIDKGCDTGGDSPLSRAEPVPKSRHRQEMTMNVHMTPPRRWVAAAVLAMALATSACGGS